MPYLQAKHCTCKTITRQDNYKLAKTITRRVRQSRLGQDKKGQGKTITDCLPSFNQVRKTIKGKGRQLHKSVRQMQESARQSRIVLHTIHLTRQDKTMRLSCCLTHAFGKTIHKNCLAHHPSTEMNRQDNQKLSC